MLIKFQMFWAVFDYAINLYILKGFKFKCLSE